MVHFHVTELGTVENPQVLRPVRADLDAEAVKVVQGWIFQPGSCEGRPSAYVLDNAVHFQGR
jgi:TonB family protein